MTDPAASTLARRISIAHLALILPWVAIVIGAWGPIGDTSFLWHIRAGSKQAARGSVLTTDPFSFTMHGEPWLTQSWLVEIFYASLERISGLGFVPWMIMVVSVLTFLGIGLVAYGYSSSVQGTVFVLVLSVLALISFMVPRPVVFSYPLMVLVILAWDRPATRWAVPFLFWLWAASHASFFIGLAYIGLWTLIRREWKAIPTLVLSGLVTLGTAHGLGVIQFLLTFGENREALNFISEWRQPELFSPLYLPFLGGLVFIVLGAFRERIFPRHLWVIVPFTLLSLSSIRSVPPAWIGILPLVALALSDLQIGTRAGLRPRLAAVFVLCVLGMPFLLIEASEIPEDRFPYAASTEMTDVPTFHDDRVGGWLIWAEGPERQVYLDDRAELYGWRMEEFVKVRTGEIDWRPVFERDGVEQAVLESDWDLIEDLVDAGWQTVYRDDSYTVLRP